MCFLFGRLASARQERVVVFFGLHFANNCKEKRQKTQHSSDHCKSINPVRQLTDLDSILLNSSHSLNVDALRGRIGEAFRGAFKRKKGSWVHMECVKPLEFNCLHEQHLAESNTGRYPRRLGTRFAHILALLCILLA